MTGSTDHSKLGTFVGVYLPTVLTILGVIMFLRTGWLVVFPEFEEVQELISGMVDIAQANGIAGLASNTVMVGWPDEESRLADFLAALAGDSPAVFFVKNSSLFSGDLLLPGDDEQAVLSADGEEPTQHKKEPNHDRSHQRAIRPVRTTGSI